MGEIVRHVVGAIAERDMSNLERKQFEISIIEKNVVLEQTHRCGRMSEMRESALGRFVEDYKCGVECYNSGFEFMCLVYKWRMASGINVPRWFREEFGGSGAEMSGDRLSSFSSDVREWNREITRCKNALKAAGAPAFKAAISMIFDGVDPHLGVCAPLKRAV